MSIFRGLFFLLPFAVVACTTSSSNTLPSINIEQAIQNVSDINLSLCASEIEYFPLETNDSINLGDINYSFTGADYIFITGKPYQRTIHLFSKDGKYIKDIGRQGRGPGEYLAVRSIITLPEKNAIMVEGGYKAVVYSLKDGAVLNDFLLDQLLENGNTLFETPGIKTQYSAQQMIKNILYHNGLFYLSITDNKEITQSLLVASIDSSTIIKQDIINFERKPATKGPWVTPSQIYKKDNELNIIHGYCDTIYKLCNNALIPRLTIDYGNFKTEKTTDVAHEQLKFCNSNTHFFETNNAILSKFYIPPVSKPIYPKKEPDNSRIGRHYETYIVYNKSTGKSAVPKYYEKYKMAGLLNDLDNGVPFWPAFGDENKLYQFIDAGKFIELSQISDSKKMKAIASTITEESNPVMIVVTLK